MTTNPNIQQNIGRTGQVAAYEEYEELEQLVYEFEEVLKRFGIPIQPGSELAKVCYSILEGKNKNKNKNQNAYICDPQEDIRHVFREVLGIWLFLRQIVRLKGHVSFSTFVPHLALLNKGTVVQNTQVRVCQETTNKIFELLFALAFSTLVMMSFLITLLRPRVIIPMFWQRLTANAGASHARLSMGYPGRLFMTI